MQVPKPEDPPADQGSKEKILEAKRIAIETIQGWKKLRSRKPNPKWRIR